MKGPFPSTWTKWPQWYTGHDRLVLWAWLGTWMPGCVHRRWFYQHDASWLYLLYVTTQFFFTAEQINLFTLFLHVSLQCIAGSKLLFLFVKHPAIVDLGVKNKNTYIYILFWNVICHFEKTTWWKKFEWNAHTLYIVKLEHSTVAVVLLSSYQRISKRRYICVVQLFLHTRKQILLW